MDSDATQKLSRPGTQTGEGSGMRDGAMARTAPRRDLERRARVAGAAGSSGSSGSTGSGSGGSSSSSGTGGRATRPAARTGQRNPATRAPRRSGPRRVRLTLQRVDPWSVMKISFLVSVALGIAGVVMVTVLWSVLSGMQVFSTVNELITMISTGEDGGPSFDLMDYLGFGRVVSLSVVIGVINVILLTALATLTAFLYNVCTALVGGAQLTLSDE
ncbi:hypothetical protein GCM10009583_18980 [Ornithinicoccus hortensis]